MMLTRFSFSHRGERRLRVDYPRYREEETSSDFQGRNAVRDMKRALGGCRGRWRDRGAGSGMSDEKDFLFGNYGMFISDIRGFTTLAIYTQRCF